MGHLLRAELTRLRWRRAVLALVALAVAVTAIVFAAQAFATRPFSEADVASGLKIDFIAQEVQRCERHPERFYGLDAAADCARVVVGQYRGRAPLDLGDVQSGTLLGVVTLVALLGALVGTTFAGHDWNSGSMSNQLLVDPRRGRVWTAKALAVTLPYVVLTGVLLAGLWTAFWALARHRGLSASSATLVDGLAECARSTALVGGVVLACFALAMLLRSTVATLAVVFAVAIVGGLLLALLGGQGTQRWQPQNNALAVVTDDVTFYTYADGGPCTVSVSSDDGFYSGSSSRFGSQQCEQVHHLDAVDGGLYTGTIVLVVGALSVLSFRRRDVP